MSPLTSFLVPFLNISWSVSQSGQFPAHLCSLNTLKLLYFCENYIFGEISREIGNWTSLEELVIYSNNLTGTIPASIRELKHLRVILAGVNSFTGPIRTT
jgi:hypothetical protein